jgi:RNA polymerase sigma factor (TIGR02999 family)
MPDDRFVTIDISVRTQRRQSGWIPHVCCQSEFAMKSTLPGEVTRVLRRLHEGDREAVRALIPLVYDELRTIAAAALVRERTGHTLQPTALVHEACMRLLGDEPGPWHDRRHFYRAAATVMRYILVNHARDRKRLKRGGGRQRLPLDDAMAVYEDRAIDLLALDEALVRLESVNARSVEVIELRFFAGLTIEETANVLGVSRRTVEVDWSHARAWLLREMTPAE